MSQLQLKNMSAHHHSLIDFILENSHEKGWRTKACAAFRITPAYLSIIWHSDVFREEFHKRLTAYRNEGVREIQAMQIALAKQAYLKLTRMLESDEVEDSLVLDIANSTMKQLGFGPTPGSAPNVTREDTLTRVQTRQVAPGVLEEARTTYKRITHEPANGSYQNSNDVQLPAAVRE